MCRFENIANCPSLPTELHCYIHHINGCRNAVVVFFCKILLNNFVVHNFVATIVCNVVLCSWGIEISAHREHSVVTTRNAVTCKVKYDTSLSVICCKTLKSLFQCRPILLLSQRWYMAYAMLSVSRPSSIWLVSRTRLGSGKLPVINWPTFRMLVPASTSFVRQTATEGGWTCAEHLS